jgi:hypothetical protein
LSWLIHRCRAVRHVVFIIFLVSAIIEATPDTVHRGRGLAELPGGPLLVP